MPDASTLRARPPRVVGRVSPLRLLFASVLPLALAGCVTQDVANRSVLEQGVQGDSGVKLGRLPACEKGQAVGDNGKCVDIVLPAPEGEPTTLRERILRQDCERAKGYLVAAVRRRDELLSVKGHDIHLGLNAIVAECRARQDQLDICARAGRYDEGSPYRREEVRLRDGLTTCNELANVYRQMLAQGLRRAP